MTAKDYAVVLLNFYYELPKSIKDQEKSFYSEALLTFKSKNVLRSVEKLIKRIEQKRTLFELYSKLEKVFSRMTSQEFEILKCRYGHFKMEYSCDNDRRKFYRNADRALKRFKELLSFIGISEEVFNSELKKQPFIHGICLKTPTYYKRVQKKGNYRVSSRRCAA
ncbi:MAG: hypothetical protein ACI4M6_01145 [Christensenellaceae bacterium]